MNFKEIPLCAHENFEEQDKALESPIIIIHYCIIIINAYCNCIINAYYNYYCAHKRFLKKCDKEENVGVAGTAAISCFRGIKRFVQWHIFAPSALDRCPSDTLPSQDFASLQIYAKMFQSQYYLVATEIHIRSLRSQVHVYADTYSSQRYFLRFLRVSAHERFFAAAAEYFVAVRTMAETNGHFDL
jgi:hypothetical protein